MRSFVSACILSVALSAAVLPWHAEALAEAAQSAETLYTGMMEREAELRDATLRAGVDIHEVSTEDDLVEALVRIVEARKRRRR